MRPTANMHTHTAFCDGKNTPEQMVEAAIRLGLTDLGFSGHSPAPFDPDYSLRDPDAYYRKMEELKQRFQGQIRIYAGEEMDFYAPPSRQDCDFLIGSVHYFLDRQTGTHYALDADRQDLQHALDVVFHGDARAMVKEFYRMSAELAVTRKPDIIGHFDLIVKLNAHGAFFDETSTWYRHTALEAITQAAASGAVFEVNTGGMYRGYRKAPYPADFLLTRLLELGTPVTLSSDSHDIHSLTFEFPSCLARLQALGFSSVQVYEDGAFREKGIRDLQGE